MIQKKVLIVDDEENMRHLLSVILLKEKYEADSASNGVEALGMLDKDSYDFILADIKMPKLDGMGLLSEIRKKGIDTTVIMMSAFGTIEIAVECMKNGAYDYISKPFKPDEVILALKKAEERERLKKENIQLKRVVQKGAGFESIITRNAAMLQIFDTIKKISAYKSTVLILGESGTGKELIARAIHYNSSRAQGPFIPVNCGAISEHLLESELFGHVKGAFTDAIRTKTGLVEEASGGTLFLDEIGELPLSLQVKLLRALQEDEIRRVGDIREIKVDVRIIAATVKDLEEEVKHRRFREDLYYRLNVLPIKLPGLRERKEDIPFLVEQFIKNFNERMGKNVKGITPDVLAMLCGHNWKGNVRELENTIERAMVFTDSEMIEKGHIEIYLSQESESTEKEPKEEEISIKKMSRTMEERLIRKALDKTGGNRTHAARLLEVSLRSLLLKMKEYGIR